MKESVSAAKKAKDSGEVPIIPKVEAAPAVSAEVTTVIPEVTTTAPLAKYVAVTRRPIISTTEPQYEVFTSRYSPQKTANLIQYPNYQQRRTRPIASRLKVRPIHTNSLDYSGDDFQIQNYDQNYYYDTPVRRNDYDPYYQTQTQNRNYLDVISTGNDGFRYYLPRHYHAEQSNQFGQRTGSFGYVDPFGIRRVIYYNTAPGTGFQHRKNNRYVGFDSPPYDP